LLLLIIHHDLCLFFILAILCGAVTLTTGVLILNIDVRRADYGSSPGSLSLTSNMTPETPTQVTAYCGNAHRCHLLSLMRVILLVKATPSNYSGLTKHGVCAEYPFGDGTDLAWCDLYLDIIQLSHNRLVLA
jgi:hypothetical protein